MKKTILSISLLLGIYTSEAQTWIHDAKDFAIKDDGATDEFMIKIPSSFTDNDEGFAFGELNNISLSLNVGIDLTAIVENSKDGKIDLAYYAKEMSDKDLYYLESGTISNKTIAQKPIKMNGVSMLEISFNYEEKDPLKKKKGKCYLYLLAVKADAAQTSKDGEVVIKLLFDYDESAKPVTSYNLHKEILKTIKKSGGD